LEPWPELAGVRRASVNNFGYGGANAHVIIEDYKSFLASKSSASNGISNVMTNGVTNGVNGVHLTNGHTNDLTNGHTNDLTNGHTNGLGHTDGLTNGDTEHITNGHTNGVVNNLNGHPAKLRSRAIILSAKDEQATEAMASRLKDFLQTTKVEDEEKFLDNLSYTLGQRRSTFPWIAAQPAQSVSSLVKAIEFGKMKPSRTSERPKIGFVFTGQGAQWYAMGRELVEAYPVYKDCLLEADSYLEGFGADWSVMGKLTRRFRELECR